MLSIYIQYYDLLNYSTHSIGRHGNKFDAMVLLLPYSQFVVNQKLGYALHFIAQVNLLIIQCKQGICY